MTITLQDEQTIAQWIAMFPKAKNADELLSMVMEHFNSFSAKMANPTSLQLAKDTLFLQLSKQEGLTITYMHCYDCKKEVTTEIYNDKVTPNILTCSEC